MMSGNGSLRLQFGAIVMGFHIVRLGSARYDTTGFVWIDDIAIGIISMSHRDAAYCTMLIIELYAFKGQTWSWIHGNEDMVGSGV